MRTLSSTLLVLALAALPATMQAQRPVLSVSGGFGVTQSDALSGSGAHLRLSVPVARLRPGLSLHAEALAQRGTISGPPSTCAAVAELDCAGRSDRNVIAGAGTYLRWELGRGTGRLRAYLVPGGLGVYHRRTESDEQQAPTRTCVRGGEVAPCPNAAPFARVSSAEDRTSPGVSAGGGMEMRVGGVRLFADARVHRLLEGGGSWAAAAPLSVGVAF